MKKLIVASIVSAVFAVGAFGINCAEVVYLSDILEETRAQNEILTEQLEIAEERYAIAMDYLDGITESLENEYNSNITSDPDVEEPVIIPVEEEIILTQDEIELIALVTMAEAEAEPEEGQRLVIDTILNRVDSEYFPDTVYDVLYQPNQFTSMTNGRIDRCYIRDDLVDLVEQEAISRYNYDVVFFRTTRYSDYGVPMFQVGHHYFSSYN